MGLVLIQGGESLLADRAISEITTSFPNAQVTSLSASEIEVGVITDSLAPSLFSDTRIVVIKEIQDLASECSDEVASYLENTDENLTLVLWHKGGVKGKALVDKIKKAKAELITAEVIKKSLDYDKPLLIRYAKKPTLNLHKERQKFEIGKAWMVNEGKDVSIFATGHLVWKAIEAGEKLAEMGIDAEIINIHTIKPLDAQAILQSVAKTGCVVSAEEHNRLGGLGDSIAQVLAQNLPTPQEYVAVNDSFGESGTPDQLMEKYGLSTEAIIAAVQKVLARKTAK